MAESTDGENRWPARPVVAGAVVLSVFALPVLLSIGAAGLIGHLWSPASTGGGVALRWVVIVGSSTVVFFGAERVTRAALPLSVLLKMGMVFPGRAPRRLSVARRAWTTRDLSRRIDEAHEHGITDEPTAAAEQIVTLAATLSAHDRKTRGHAERVRAYTDLMAEELRLPDDDRDRLRWSALLHDVGKLTVHSEILNKPGSLTDDEWELMRQHPLEGARLTAPLAGWLGPWANTIAEHHERFDGRGYPFGLAGHDISMGGRIVAVADCYDTMTSLRSYQKPMSAAVARQELAACAGAQFDPVMVRAFLNVSVRRLHAVAPLTWIGSLPFGNVGTPLAQLAATGGRMALTGVAATAGVIGLTAGAPVSAGQAPAADAAHGTALTGSGPTGAGGRSGLGQGDGGPAAASTGPSGGGRGTGSGPESGTATTSAGGRAGSVGTRGGSTDGKTDDQIGAVPGPGSATTVASTGTPTDTPTGTPTGTSTGTPTGPSTTVGGTTPPAGTTTTTTATTTTVPAPLVAPTGVEATASCRAIILLPEVTVTWTESPVTRVTGYAVLRSATQTSGYISIATVASRGTTSYADTTASGLGTKYWYEVEAVAGSSTSPPSVPISVTTQSLCL